MKEPSFPRFAAAVPRPAAEPHDAQEQACLRAWQSLRGAGVQHLLAATLRHDGPLAQALQDAFHAGRLPGEQIEAEVDRALRDGPSDATLLALTLLAAVALDRFQGGRRARELAATCARLARAPQAAAVAGPVLRAHAVLVLARGEPLREATLQQAEACRIEVDQPAALARNAVVWSGMRMLSGAPLPELLNYAEAVRQAGGQHPPSVALSQLDGRIHLFRMLAGAVPHTPFAAPAMPRDTLQFGCWLGCLQSAWFLGDDSLGRSALAMAERLISPLTPPCELLPYRLFAVLLLARTGGPAAQLRAHRRALQDWARHCAAWAGAMAELARAAEHAAAGTARALSGYERAAQLAQGAGQAWVAALAWEGAAALGNRLDMRAAAAAYRRLALDTWRDWGAHGRVRVLMQGWDSAAGPDCGTGDHNRAARADTVGELGITIAHEVNQPLAAILLHAAAGRRWLRRAEPDVGRALEALEQITVCGRQAGDIVRSVRGLARRQSEDISTFAIDPALAEVAQLLRALMLRQGVQLDTRLQLPGRQLRASRAQIQQILMNLLLNAIEALAPVTDRQRRIVLESSMLGMAQVELRVTDNGPGVAPRDRARIFDALYSTKPNGTGVGLSISRAIAEAHGGSIEFVPAEPHGAVFRVVLPLRGAAAPCAPADASRTESPLNPNR